MNTNKACVPFGLIAVILFLSVSPVEGDVYRYVDPDGVIHFTNTPTSPKFKLYMKEKKRRRGLDPERSRRFDPVIYKVAKKHGVDIPLVMAVIKVESNFDPVAVSSKGARGLMQLMPETARSCGVGDCFNPMENIEGGVRHLRDLLERFKGRLTFALAAYNAGKDAVVEHGGIPPYPETRDYVDKVLRYYAFYKSDGRW